MSSGGNTKAPRPGKARNTSSPTGRKSGRRGRTGRRTGSSIGRKRTGGTRRTRTGRWTPPRRSAATAPGRRSHGTWSFDFETSRKEIRNGRPEGRSWRRRRCGRHRPQTPCHRCASPEGREQLWAEPARRLFRQAGRSGRSRFRTRLGSGRSRRFPGGPQVRPPKTRRGFRSIGRSGRPRRGPWSRRRGARRGPRMSAGSDKSERI